MFSICSTLLIVLQGPLELDAVFLTEALMPKNAKSRSGSKSKGLSSAKLFGPPPLLYGEDEAACDQMLARVGDALAPRDFIEEIWVHDLVNAAWNIIRLRRIQTAFLDNTVQDDVNERAASLTNRDPRLMQGTEEEDEEMWKLRVDNSEQSWDELKEQYPLVYKKYQERWEEIESTLDEESIQVEVIIREFDTIERIENLIALSQRRLDAVIREFDRHRFIQDQRNSVQNVIEAEFKTVKPAPVAKITNKKVA